MLASHDRVFIGDAVADEDGLSTFADRALLLVRGLYRRSRFTRRGGRRTTTTDVERDEWLVDFQDVADVAVKGGDGSRVGARQFHRRLGGLDVDQRLVQDDDVADLDLPRHDLGFGQSFTDVGEEEYLFAQLSNPITRSTASRIRSTVGR